MPLERLEAVVTGRVQLVMYRDFVMRKARSLKLAGYVRNQKDGSVQVVAEGARSTLEKLEKRLHGGSILSKVEKVSAAWLPGTGTFSSFQISYE